MRLARFVVGVAALVWQLAGPLAAHVAPVREYDALRAARPDGRVIPVKGLVLQRDACRIELRSGAVHLLAPLGEDTFGAVFIGDGTSELTPASEAERRHLRLVTGNRRLDQLTDRFDRLVLLFSDATARELLAHAPVVGGAPDRRAAAIYEDYLEQQRTRVRINLHLRVLADLLNRPERTDGVFLAWVDGADHPPALVAIDPLGISNLAAQFGLFGGEETAHLAFEPRGAGFWYLSARTADAVGGRGKPVRPWADAAHYAIDTTIDGTQVAGRTTITLTPLVEGIRVLPVHLFQPLSRRVLGLERADPRAAVSLDAFARTVGWHEMAHQWWGHQVGWASYRDQWLSEGFAEFTAALVLQFSQGAQRYDEFWETRRDEILTSIGGTVANHEAGAISQGFRLGTPRSPGAARAMVYAKGAYVLQMLRMMMQLDGQPNPDAAFQVMMREFASTWGGKNPSSDDFRVIAERHMSPEMNLGGDGTLQYFFDQWVHGTEIPAFSSTLAIKPVGGGRYRISGTVRQEGVSEGFRTLVPIYLDFGDRLVKLGTTSLVGSTIREISGGLPLPQTPRRVLVNARHDVLAR